MKKMFMLTIIVLLVAAGGAFAAGLEVKQKSGEYTVEVKFDKDPPVAGNNNIEIEVMDASGQYVTDATVKVDYSMPAMPGMPAMNYKTDASLSGRKYTAKMNLSMSGSWNIAVKITKGGKTSAVKFNVDAQ
jgi:hypothetical protein